MSETLRRTLFSTDTRDLLFRGLFSTIFVGLGMEHLFDDHLIQHLMPSWVTYPQAASVLSGIVLLTGGLSILLGYRIRLGAMLLGLFLLVVTLAVHVPGLFVRPGPMETEWLWTVFQRSNLVKNLCLFGVCIHLTQHEPGKYSVDRLLARRSAARKRTSSSGHSI